MFQEYGVTRQTSHAAVTVAQVFGSVGGNLNLWIGLTFFALIELVEMLYLCVMSSLRGRSDRVDVVTTDVEQ